MKENRFWCLVHYIGLNPTPWYYCGSYLNQGYPAVSNKFADALKLHSQEEATRISVNVEHCPWRIEQHMYA